MFKVDLRFIFKDCTKRSANPLEAGWSGAQQICLIPFDLVNAAKSSDTNCGPLLVTNCSGGPKAANIFLNISIVLAVVVSFMM